MPHESSTASAEQRDTAVGAISSEATPSKQSELESAPRARDRSTENESSYVWLRVLERDTRAPIAGARVQRQTRMSGGEFVVEGTSDADGWMRLRPPPLDDSAYSASSAIHGAALFALERDHPDHEHAQLVELERAASLVVTCASAKGQSFRGVKVEATIAARSVARDLGSAVVGADWTVMAIADERGRARLEHLSANAELRVHAAIANASGVEHIDVTAPAPGDEGQLAWLVPDVLDVDGTLVDERNQPLAASEVWLLRQDWPSEYEHERVFASDDTPAARATTDGAGRFHFRSLEFGHWWIGPGAVDGDAHDRARALPAIAESVDVDPRAYPIEPKIRVQRGGFITGRLEHSDGTPAKGEVRARPSQLGGNARVRTTADDGTFELGPFALYEYELIGVDPGSGVSTPAQHVWPGASDVVLRLGRAATIRARILAVETREPIASEVWLMQHDERSRAITSAFATGTRSVELLGVVAGSYDLIARAGERIALLTKLEPKAGDVLDVTLEMQRAARLRLTNWTSARSRVYRVRAQGVVFGEGTLSPGDTAKVQVVPGSARVELGLTWSPTLTAREVDLKSDEEFELELGEP